jgi:hypothetical protein
LVLSVTCDEFECVDKELLGGIRILGEHRGLLDVGALFEKDIRWVLRVVRCQEGDVVLAHGVWCWFAVCCCELVEDVAN